MKSENLNKIKDLLSKYQEGKTSLEEEKSLIAFFNSKDVPQELADYQAEFNYYATFRNINFTGSIEQPLNITQDTLLKKIGQFFSKWFTQIVIVILPVILLILFQNRTTKEEVSLSNQKVENHSTILKVDSTSTEKMISKLKPTRELDNSNHSEVSHKSLSQNKETTTTNKLQVPASDSIIPDRPPIQKKDTVLIAESDNNKVSSINLNTSEGTAIDNLQNLPGASPNNPAPDLEKVVFKITESTTTGELAAIARKAKRAGIEYTYIVDQHKKKTHELNIVMIIRSTGERSQFWISYPKKSSFSETIYWSVDKDGQAVSLCPEKIEHKVKAKHPLK